ncbi:MAG: pyridoxal-phosphate dependent enzyme [Conexivisphaerales archaeon]
MDSLSVFCNSCGRVMENPLEYRCTCGGVFKIEIKEAFKRSEDKVVTLERYRPNFPYIRSIVSLGEQSTPLVKLNGNVMLKLDYMNPTGSFKDRGSATLVSAVKSYGKDITELREDSSGNAGASLAAYSARAGYRCHVFVPHTASGAKLEQIKAYGAKLTVVKGSRAQVGEKAQDVSAGGIYVGHSWHPYFRDGMRTLAYEISEQTKLDELDYVFCPVSAGTLFLGIVSGFRHLLESGVVKRMPKIIACQTSKVSPFYHALKGTHYRAPSQVSSVADALVSTKPPLLELMVNEAKSVGADAEAVEERYIVAAWKELALHGFFVEPSSAVAYAAYKQYSKRKDTSESSTVIVLTGSGLKRPTI